MQTERRAAMRPFPVPDVTLRDRLDRIAGRLRRGSFSRNLSVMLAGTVLGQGTSLLLAPALTRIYSPEEFGYLSAYTAALSILCVVASLGLEIAIPIAVDVAETANLTALCGVVLVATTAVVAGVSYAVSPRLLDLLLLGPVASYRWLIPVGFACFGAYYIMVATATRQAAFREIAHTRIAQGVTGPVTQIGLGLAGFGAPGLVVGFVLGQSAGVGLLLRRSVLASKDMIAAMSWRGMRQVWWRYLSFPLWVSWARLLDMAGGATIYLILTALFSPVATGLLFLSDRVIARPLLIVSSSFLQVFAGEAGRSVREDPVQLRKRFRQVVLGQGLLALGWIAVANVAAGWLFPLFFGQRWADAVGFLHAMSLGYLVMTVVHPVSTTLQMLERQALNAAWQAARLAAVLLAVIGAWRAGLSAVQAIWCYSVVQAVFCVILLGLIAWSIERLQVPAAQASAALESGAQE